MEEMTFKVMNDNGEEVECQVLFTFESEETGKNYVAFTDGTTDEDGCTKIYANVIEYDENDETATLRGIETDEEYAVIEDILQKLQTEEGAEELLNEAELSPEMRDYFMDGMK